MGPRLRIYHGFVDHLLSSFWIFLFNLFSFFFSIYLENFSSFPFWKFLSWKKKYLQKIFKKKFFSLKNFYLQNISFLEFFFFAKDFLKIPHLKNYKRLLLFFFWKLFFFAKDFLLFLKFFEVAIYLEHIVALLSKPMNLSSFWALTYDKVA